MPEFLQLLPPDKAIEILLDNITVRNHQIDEVNTIDSFGRVCAEDIVAPHALPEFERSAVDGYAVRAKDTFGVTDSFPGYLNFIGEVCMGESSDLKIEEGSCALIHTGGMIPFGADAVIMIENTQMVSLPVEIGMKGAISGTNHLGSNTHDKEVEITHSVAVGENIIHVGEDMKPNQVIIKKGTRIRSVEIGGCMAYGIITMRVAIKPKIGIISSGNELIDPSITPTPGQIRDINSYSLAALFREVGAAPIHYGIIKDDLEQLKSAANRALNECDMVVITAGSSASVKDLTATAISSLGKPGILVHGINIRPGKPTILAVCNNKPVIGLPGNPVSALVIARLFIIPVIEKMIGQERKKNNKTHAKISVNIASQAGREDWIAVKLVSDDIKLTEQTPKAIIAEPVFAKSNLIFSLVAADGLVRIDSEKTGVAAGEEVEVVLI